ncbi:MAG: hypothetical protein WCG04_06725, partial [Alphaproteobacteria bacterium]
PNYKALSNIMINRRERAKPANKREFMMMIQAWRRIASETKSNDKKSNEINRKLDVSKRSDKENTLIAFNYLRNFTGSNNKQALDNTKDTLRSLDPGKIERFAAKIDATLAKIDQDADTQLAEIVGVVGADEESKEASAVASYRGDYATTNRLVIFEFENDDTIKQCLAPHAAGFEEHSPRVMYRRPVPAIRAGANFAQHLLIDAAVPGGDENKGIKDYYLYKFLLTDDSNNEMLYGLPNPVLEPTASLIQLSRGPISKSMKDRADKVSTWIKENNYLLPAVQHLGDRYMEKYIPYFNEQPPQEGIVLADVYVPGFDVLRKAQVYVPSTRASQTPQQKQKGQLGSNIFFDVPEAILTNRLNTYIFEGIVPAQIALAYFRDKRAYGYSKQAQEGIKEDLASIYTLDMLNDRANNKSAANNLNKILLGDEPKFVLIRSDEDTKVSFTGQGGNRVTKWKSNPNYWEQRKAHIDQNDAPIRELFVLQTLYRWDDKSGKLIQVSIGMPEITILEKKAALEEELRAAARGKKKRD